ncbi:MAG: hypothetical protein IPH28_11145 [Cytophagaceae bacterium]|nr:hypothetical protein [Cytophagaceae bacterium]
MVEFTNHRVVSQPLRTKVGMIPKTVMPILPTGKSQTVVLESGENNPTIDAGYFKPATT